VEVGGRDARGPRIASRLMSKRLLGVALVCGLLGVAAVGQPPANIPPANVPATPPKKATLEDDITRALRTHPDVHVAEAEAQLANAKLQQAKLAVSQRVTAAKGEKEQAAADLTLAMKRLESAKRTLDVNEKQFQTIKQLQGMGRAATLELAQHELVYEKARQGFIESEQAIELAKAKVAAAEAAYDTLVGKAAAAKTVNVNVKFDEPRQGLLDVYDVQQKRALAYLRSKPGSVADRLRTALTKSVVFECKNQGFRDVTAALRKAAGADVLFRVPDFNLSLTLGKEDLPLAAWLELLRDEWNGAAAVAPDVKPHEWYVREYGLLFSSSGRPEGALTLGEFVKAVQQEAEKPKADGKKE
jgi:hypothetical protein